MTCQIRAWEDAMDRQSEVPSRNAGLTPQQLQLLREKLEALREQLQVRRATDEGVVRDESPMPMEPMEAAVRTREQDDALLAFARGRTLLADVERALAKLATGRYGLSERSGEPIGYARLQAVPWARHTAPEEEEEAARQ
jgi:DnaK suppressor protein